MSQRHRNCSTATLGRVKPRRDGKEHGKSIRLATQNFINGTEPSVRSAAHTYNIPYTTLGDRLCGLQNRPEAHRGLQLLSVQEEKAIVRLRETLDGWGHPAAIEIPKRFAQSLLPVQRRVGNTEL